MTEQQLEHERPIDRWRGRLRRAMQEALSALMRERLAAQGVPFNEQEADRVNSEVDCTLPDGMVTDMATLLSLDAMPDGELFEWMVDYFREDFAGEFARAFEERRSS